jgi:hypothetical protein
MNKGCWAINGTIDMRLCGKVENRIGPKAGKSICNGLPIGNVCLHPLVAIRPIKRIQRTGIPCISELVDVQDPAVGPGMELAD